MHVGPHPAGHAAEQRRAVGRALLDGDPLQRQLEHGGDDLQPLLAARAAARRAAALRRRAPSPATRSSESRSPQATPSSTARTSAPRSWRIDSPVNDAARVRVGVRRALAGQVRQERQALDARLPPRRLVDQVGELAPADDVAQPGERAGRARASRPSRARRPAPRGRTRGRAPAGRRRTRAAPRTPRRRCRAPPTAAPAGRRPRRARPPPGRPRRPPPGCRPASRPDTSGDSSSAREPGRGRAPARSSTSSLQRRARDVEQQRARGVGHVDRPLAGQPQPHVVLGQHHVRDARVDVGLVRAQPQQLGRGEAGQRAVAGQLDEARRSPTRSSISAHSAPVRWSFHRIAGRITASAASSVTSRASGPRARSRRRRRASPSSASSVARHQSSGSCSDQPGLRRGSG